MVALRQGLIEIDLPSQEKEAADQTAAVTEQPAAEPATPGEPSKAIQQAAPEQPPPQPPLRLWQRIYLLSSILLVALGLWLIWPRAAQPTGPFPGPQSNNPGSPPGRASRWKALAQLSVPRRRLAVAAPLSDRKTGGHPSSSQTTPGRQPPPTGCFPPST